MNKCNSILFLGDVIPFKPFKFRNDYKTVINLESPIIHDGVPVSGKINLRVESNYLKNIFKTNLFCVSLGNNHILDFGTEGLLSTIKELQDSGINHFGLIDNFDNEKITPEIYEFNNLKLAFISVVCESTTPLLEVDNMTHLSLLNFDNIAGIVSEIRSRVHRIVLYIHWGIEESSYPAPQDILMARRLIDAGVDIIIGSHAHAPQPVEKYKNGIIAYNLGNFIMPEFKKIPSYFNESGIAGSFYSKKLMLWNRISWGLIVDMKSMEFKIKKYLFLTDRIFELAITPFDKYIKLKNNSIDQSYESVLNMHLKRRAFRRKILDFLYRPYIPHKLLGHENRSFIKLK